MFPHLDRLAPDLASRLQALADLIALAVGVLWLCEWQEPALVWLASMAWVTALAVLRTYQPGRADAAFRAAVVACTALVVEVLVGFTDAAREGVLPVAVAGGALAGSTCAGALLRVWIKHAALPVVVVGSGPLAQALVTQLGAAVPPRQVTAVLPLPGDDTHTATRSFATWTAMELRDVLTRSAVAEVFVAGNPVTQAAEMARVVAVCEVLGLPFALPAHVLPLERARPWNVQGLTAGFMHYVSGDPRPVGRAFKRLFDVVASAGALVVLSPLLVAVAVAIKLTSRGPVLFRQQRVGLHGRTFNMLKFRSMVVDAEAALARIAHLNEQTGPVFKMVRDPRVTAVGRFIRRYSIDELPQLINILRGDMSVVGPRPPIPAEVARYEPWQRRRLSVRPGLTCFWQVSGRNHITFQQWMLMDMRYIDQWSFMTDLRLILATIPAVLTARGAS